MGQSAQTATARSRIDQIPSGSIRLEGELRLMSLTRQRRFGDGTPTLVAAAFFAEREREAAERSAATRKK